jgi:amino-acid N-acetyltransferase
VAVEVTIRQARTPDVPAIKALVDIYAGSGRKMLAKQLVTIYEDVQDFRVAEVGDEIVGCGALHVLWADLGEMVGVAEALGLCRLFALTFQTEFFAAHGFVEFDGRPVDEDTYDALRRSYDEGVAEFLGLEYVKPNTLGNVRMLLKL